MPKRSVKGFRTKGEGRDRVIYPITSKRLLRFKKAVARVEKYAKRQNVRPIIVADIKTGDHFRVHKHSPVQIEKLHPFVAKPDELEPILTTSQKLTPAQKQHLREVYTRSQLFEHLGSFHAMPFEEMKETELAHRIDPQVMERFGLSDRPLTGTTTLRLRHLQEHLENIAERKATAPGGVHGVTPAPGFEHTEKK